MRTLLLSLIFAAAAHAQQSWNTPFPPHKVIGNVYFIGSKELASFLITTPEGHILVNTGLASTVPDIVKNVEALGFHMADVRILTVTHGHYDHAAGLAELKRLTHARVLAPEADKVLLETGGRADFRFGQMAAAQFEPVTVDGTFGDEGTISLGGTTLTAHLHAGHTRGATSFTTTIADGGRSYRVAIVNMGSINPGVTLTGTTGFTYPGIAQDYAKTFLAQKDMQVDIFLASHASQFRMHEKHAPGDAYAPERFVDPQGFLRAVQDLEKAYLAQLASERARH
mgnify:CR=1 FL=1